MIIKNRLFLFVGIISLLVFFDQFIKYLVEYNLPFQSEVPLFSILSFFRTHNTGIAFSMLNNVGPWILTAVSLLVIVVIFIIWRKTPVSYWLMHMGFILIVSGAVGNIIDRVMFGYVIDYILSLIHI